MRGTLLFGVAFLGGLALFGCLGGGASYAVVKSAEAKVRRGWNLVPVTVYAKDLAAGDVATFENISQRAVPEQLVTSSVVKPDSASYVVNQAIRVPVRAGDPAVWTHFDTPDKQQSKEAAAACAKRFAPPRLASPDEIRAELKR